MTQRTRACTANCDVAQPAPTVDAHKREAAEANRADG
jgi:hypothetical protein